MFGSVILQLTSITLLIWRDLLLSRNFQNNFHVYIKTEELNIGYVLQSLNQRVQVSFTTVLIPTMTILTSELQRRRFSQISSIILRWNVFYVPGITFYLRFWLNALRYTIPLLCYFFVRPISPAEFLLGWYRYTVDKSWKRQEIFVIRYGTW